MERWFSSMCYPAIFFLGHPGPVSFWIPWRVWEVSQPRSQPLLKHLNLKMTYILSIHRPEQKLVKGFYLHNSESGKWNFHLESCFPEIEPCYGNSVGSCSHLCHRCPWWDKHCLPESRGLHRSGGTCLKTWIMSMHYSGWSTRRMSQVDWTTCAMAGQLDRIDINRKIPFCFFANM